MADESSDISRKLAILEEIASLISRSHEVQDTLDQICRLVTRQMGYDVCSVYLLDESGKTLILRATQGLDPKSVGKVTMSTREGITGLAVEQMRVVAVDNAPEHPRYKYFPETSEEKYLSLLACPIVEKGRPVGVMNVQMKESRGFSADEIRVITSIATQVGVIVQNYRLLQAVTRQQIPLLSPAEATRPAPPLEDHRPGTVLRGIGASPGISMGRADVIDQDELAQLFEVKADAKDPEAEAAAFETALGEVRAQIKDAELRIAERLSDEEANIFATHLMILEDEGFLGKIREELRAGRSALFAVRGVVAHYVQLFDGIKDEYMREKISDVEDVGKRLLNALSRRSHGVVRKDGEKGILVSWRVTPSEAAALDGSEVAGFISAQGGANSHAAILARSFEIPAVVGIETQIRQIHDGDFLILDGTLGNIYVNPDKEVVKEFRRAKREYDAIRHEIETESQGRAATKDQTRVHLLANVSIAADVKAALALGAEGIGLYRTEFLYLTRATFPTEEEQLKVYAHVVKQMKGHRVVIRTLDLGGDKFSPEINAAGEGNPYLGWRSIRISLDLVHIFKAQLRAILRAAVHGKVSILFPMISNVEELDRARIILEETKEELAAEGVPFEKKVPVGMMVEVPSAALLAPQFAGLVDFFSIGTNDLTQYTLAVDRNNQRVASLFDPFHPAVLHLIDLTVRAAKAGGKEVTVCGELSGSPDAIPILLGMGCRSLSMTSSQLPLARYVIRALSLDRCEKITRRVLRFSSGSEVREYLREEIARLDLPELQRLRELSSERAPAAAGGGEGAG